jgi:hypothetical protein
MQRQAIIVNSCATQNIDIGKQQNKTPTPLSTKKHGMKHLF